MTRHAGYSLVELLVVIAVVAVLAAFTVPRYLSQRQRASETRIIALLDSIRSGLGAYEARNGNFSGLPCDNNQDGWEALRSALSPFITLPSWSDVAGLVVSFGTCDGFGSLAGKGHVAYARPAGGTGQFEYAAATDGVYRCSWSGGLSGCVRVGQ
ncbi:MAG: prepilin-type N-terminal cleavage/methylation domain-containing protein [Armatimonadota bacterium]|nr:prepilin-type N-terminal cleavage/methylation domain-containing protein [Armatimonadota bacterium]MDR7613135.1 prepilin-type N-terminal cleavage/methylation domain-containing protein [Armatimonadota bacterium]